ncbi:MAG: glycogen/starch synthase [Saprospiraceae bacterium]|nr:glycogen/starch synthase [Saprospiraceae bacterium]MBK9043728.1 glycogen/starch synthase [Saprospiraceae bacterium]
MKVLFASAECYPVAKVGGLADVVGSLPKYLQKAGVETHVVIPGYLMPWFDNKLYKIVHYGHYNTPHETIYFEVRYYIDDVLGFPFYTIFIPGKNDRYGVYADKNGYYFQDEIERNIAFQRCLLMWVRDNPMMKPDILHCHDHHTGLIPFLKQHAYEFESIRHIPVVFTIHNERYQGAFSWTKSHLLPQFDSWKTGLLDWNNTINPLASAVRVSYKVTTVSPNYLNELMYDSMGLESLFRSEIWKCSGILNGIDNETWDPKTDPMLEFHLDTDVIQFKQKNKEAICKKANLDPNLPLYGFIGRLVHEKGADQLAGLIYNWLSHHRNANFIILGTGDKGIEHQLMQLAYSFPSNVASMLAYNEALAHQIYAASDFLLMPSRVEPCGLNQLFAMRYGTIPIVRTTGGLKDSVKDLSEEDGVGIRFDHLTMSDMSHAMFRSYKVYEQKEYLNSLVAKAMSLDFSWDVSAQRYKAIYESVL